MPTTSAAIELPAGFSSTLTLAGGIRLHHVQSGVGPVVVLLHGWPQTWRAWRHVMPLLATTHHVIAVDLPGLGASECPLGGFGKRSLARDVHDLLAQLGHRPLALVGHDLGAAVAYAFAKQFPQDVGKLILMDDPLPGLGNWDDVRGAWPRWHSPFTA